MEETLEKIREAGLEILGEIAEHVSSKYPDLPMPSRSEEVYVEEDTKGPVIVAMYDHYLASVMGLEEMPIGLLRASDQTRLDVVVAHGTDALLIERDAIYVRWGIRSRNGQLEIVHYACPPLAGYIRLSPFDHSNDLDQRMLRQRSIPGIFNLTFEKVTVDKTKSLVYFHKNGVPIPDSCAFLRDMRPGKLIHTDWKWLIQPLEGLTWAEEQEAVAARVRELSERGMFETGAVIKPTDASLGMGVTILPEASVDQVVADILSRDYNTLVQTRVVPTPLRIDEKEFDWNYRVMVTRNSANQPSILGTEIRYGPQGGVVNAAQGAKRMSFEVFCEAMGRDQQTEWAKIEALALRMFGALELAPGADQPEQDYAGLDIIEDGAGIPYAMEINGSLAMGYLGLDELQPEEPSSIGALVQLMSLRAQIYTLSREHLLQRSAPPSS